MNNDKVIEIRDESERRHFARRREDQALVRERRYHIFWSAFRAYVQRGVFGAANRNFFIDEAEALLAEIESREQEREKEKE
jgi:hypothetical protein